ncbi:MAG: helix-turn-helix transcriptional regulator [Coriobacteriales bacterium]|jgi:DNA-binding CsgD family transcriptional regulator|nr:helix-turn-helix transcriptional regulator [Coriobacteriales bacterium]
MLASIFISIFRNFHVSMLGLAVLLAINATLLWGGAFPFLPMQMQTSDVMITFYLLQSIAFWGTMLTNSLGAYLRPSLSQRILAFFNGVPIFLGCSCLIATLYIPHLTMVLICVGALLLGAGCAGYFVLLQRFFASKDPKQGTLFIIVGTGLSAIIYFLLCLVPIAVTSFVIPLILVPLCGLCIVLSTREIDFAQPMFEDIPSQNRHVYFNTIKGYWPSAICVGCLGFVSGIIRAVALTEPSVGIIINTMSMFGALTSAIVLLILWRKTSFHLDVISAFRLIFPFIVTSFLLLPFLGVYFLDVFAAALYMVFSFALTIMMLQCAQASRDIGINPVFIFGFFGTIVYLFQSIGFIMGTYSGFMDMFGYSQIVIIALGAVWLLGMSMFAVRGSVRDVYSLLASQPSRVEFLRHSHVDTLKPGVGMVANHELHADVFDADADADVSVSTKHEVHAGANIDVSPALAHGNNANYRDRLSKRCAVIKRQYLLSAREAEVMEHIARGNSVARIAEVLVVSENTVRTHSKRIYGKLGIHKRQSLLDLLEENYQELP